MGEAGGLSLLQPLTARPAALGEAISAEGGGVEMIGYNPAGLSTMENTQIGAMYHPGFAGDSFASAVVGLPVSGWGAAAGIAYYNAGSVQWLDSTGAVTSVAAQRDLLGQAAAGYSFPGTGISVGACGRLIHTELLEAISTTQGAADLGARLEVPAAGLAMGVALQHLGGKVHLEDDRSDLPVQLRIGAAYRFETDSSGIRFGAIPGPAGERPRARLKRHGVTALAEYALRFREDAAGFGVGLEYTYGGLLALRAGARSLAEGAAARHDVYGLGLGVTVRAVRFDYSVEILPFTYLSRFSVTVLGRRE